MSKKDGRANECGHPEKRHFSRGMCKTCYAREWRRNDPIQMAKHNERGRKWRARHLEIARRVERNSKKVHGVANWSTKLFYKFGITAEDYYNLLAKQGGKCALCGEPPRDDKRLSVDHDHATGKIRGLLCTSCNVGLGRYEEFSRNPRVQEYLAGSNVVTQREADKNMPRSNLVKPDAGSERFASKTGEPSESHVGNRPSRVN